MKKIICIVLLTVIVVFAGCSNEKKQEQNTSEDLTTSKKTVLTTTEKNSELPILYTDPNLQASFNAPDYIQSTNGASKIFTANGYFIIFCRGGDEKSISLTEINDYNLQVFDYSTSSESRYGNPKKIVSETTKEITINGIDMLRFVGYINYKDLFTERETDGFAMGYTLIVKGVPCQLIGAITELEQSQATKDKLTKDVDAMIQTIKINQP